MPISNFSTIPAELATSDEYSGNSASPSTSPLSPLGDGRTSADYATDQVNSQLCTYVTTWRNQLKSARADKVNIWNECWQLYRGLEDFSDKEDWQSKIVLPKAWSSVKQATNVIKRLLSTAKSPWNIESVNNEDLVTAIRAEQMTELTKFLLEQASYQDEFAEALECAFIMGIGLLKVWWGLTPQTRTRAEVGMGPEGPMKQIVREEFLQGRLMVRAVDPYNFYWLPGSKLNRWVGTLEEVEIPKWELIDMADQGLIDPKAIAQIGSQKLDASDTQTRLRFSEPVRPGNGPDDLTAMVKLSEYYGPLILNGKMVEKNAHIIIANDTVPLLPNGYQRNKNWHRRPPYIGFSPLSLPFRTEGVGLVEMTRKIDKALSQLSNLSVDTLLFRLLPVFEINLDAFDNPEDFETGMVPGKLFKRNSTFMGEGIKPIEFQDISVGTIQVAGLLDRAHQEGALVSEIQESLPRFRGVQSATEVEAKSANQESFFGNMAADIEKQALEPLIELAVHLVLQFIDTSNDPRVASILGVGADTLRTLSREDLFEMVSGDYKIKVSGISGQLQKAEMLQNLVQFMNLIGQNPEAWLPYINQSALLQRILEAFRPAIHDIENIIADEQVAAAKQEALTGQQMKPEMLQMIPQLVQMATQAQQQTQQMGMQEQQMAADQSAQAQQMALEAERMALERERLKQQANTPAAPEVPSNA